MLRPFGESMQNVWRNNMTSGDIMKIMTRVFMRVRFAVAPETTSFEYL